MKIISIVGARPNFMKIAPFIRAIEKHNAGLEAESGEKVDHMLVHTGQHYDHQMSQIFFDSLNIPPADIHLGVGSGTHAEQVGYTMIAFEKVLMEWEPDWVVVVGDVNATLACAVTAKKLHVKVCHIEAGLRSGDWTMPEEINRIVTDRLSDLLLTPDRLSVEVLKKEGIDDSRIKLVGNIMIDSLLEQRDKAAALDISDVIRENLVLESLAVPAIKDDHYVVITLHRPSNVDDPAVLRPLIDFLCDELAEGIPLLWPMHPRTRKQLEQFDLWDKVVNTPNLVLLRPLAYHDLLRLNMTAKLILTDSGGLQGESVVLGLSCLILRENTEWTVTLRENGGSSVLVGNKVNIIREEYLKAIKSRFKGKIPEYWDAYSAIRCLDAILGADTN